MDWQRIFLLLVVMPIAVGLTARGLVWTFYYFTEYLPEERECRRNDAYIRALRERLLREGETDA